MEEDPNFYEIHSEEDPTFFLSSAPEFIGLCQHPCIL